MTSFWLCIWKGVFIEFCSFIFYLAFISLWDSLLSWRWQVTVAVWPPGRLRLLSPHPQTPHYSTFRFNTHVLVDVRVGEATGVGAGRLVWVCLAGLRGCRTLQWSVGIESIWDRYRTIKWTQQPSVHIGLLLMAVNIFICTISCLPVVVEVRCDHQNQDVVVRWFLPAVADLLFFLFSTVRLTFFTSLGHTTFLKNTQLRFYRKIKAVHLS